MNAVRSLAVAVLALTVSSCGSSLSLSNLRCRTPCQSVEDPYKLFLSVDYTDPDSLLGLTSTLTATAGTETVVTAKVDTLTDVRGKSGTLDFELNVPLQEFSDGARLAIGAAVTARDGSTSNEARLDFIVHL